MALLFFILLVCSIKGNFLKVESVSGTFVTHLLMIRERYEAIDVRVNDFFINEGNHYCSRLKEASGVALNRLVLLLFACFQVDQSWWLCPIPVEVARKESN
jgi:hypothetical protein